MKAYITEVEIVQDEEVVARLEAFDEAWVVKIDRIMSSEELRNVASVLCELEKGNKIVGGGVHG